MDPIDNEKSNSSDSTDKEISGFSNMDRPELNNNEQPGSPNSTSKEVSGSPTADLRITVNEGSSDSYNLIQEEHCSSEKNPVDEQRLYTVKRPATRGSK